jgi:hypothetical protein
MEFELVDSVPVPDIMPENIDLPSNEVRFCNQCFNSAKSTLPPFPLPYRKGTGILTKTEKK